MVNHVGNPKTSCHQILKKVSSFLPDDQTGFTKSTSQLKTRNQSKPKCEDSKYYFKVLQTDETTFINCEIYNRLNKHFWKIKSSHKVCEKRFETKFIFSICSGLTGYFFFIYELNLKIFLGHHLILPFIFRFN